LLACAALAASAATVVAQTNSPSYRTWWNKFQQRLLYENRLGEDDLRGLLEEKMKSIRAFAQFLGRDAA